MIVASWDRAHSRLRSVSNVEALGRSSSELLTEIVLFVVLGVLSYGLLIPSLGYYWDDWRILWIGSGHSPTNLLENYAYRPGTAWLFSALNRYVGTNYPLAHCMALALRITSSLVFWRIVRLAWPSCPTLAFASSALFLVYPGFSQQSISLTYQNYHLCILLCLLSLLLMLKGLFNERFHIKCLLIFASLILQMTYLLIIDGMISWEAMCWALILMLALRYSGSVWAALALSISRAFPFVLTAIAFVLWRSFFVRSSRVDVDFTAVLSSWRSLSFREIATRIPGGVLSNILDCSIFAWPVQAWKGANYSDRALLAGLCVAVFGAALSYLRLRRWSAGEGPKSWSREFILVGGFSLLIMSIFQCILRRNVHLDDESDRFAYSASAAAVFLVVGLSGLSLGRRATVYFITLLIGLSILSDFSHACIYLHFPRKHRTCGD